MQHNARRPHQNAAPTARHGRRAVLLSTLGAVLAGCAQGPASVARVVPRAQALGSLHLFLDEAGVLAFYEARFADQGALRQRHPVDNFFAHFRSEIQADAQATGQRLTMDSGMADNQAWSEALRHPADGLLLIRLTTMAKARTLLAPSGQLTGEATWVLTLYEGQAQRHQTWQATLKAVPMDPVQCAQTLKQRSCANHLADALFKALREGQIF